MHTPLLKNEMCAILHAFLYHDPGQGSVRVAGIITYSKLIRGV